MSNISFHLDGREPISVQSTGIGGAYSIRVLILTANVSVVSVISVVKYITTRFVQFVRFERFKIFMVKIRNLW